MNNSEKKNNGYFSHYRLQLKYNNIMLLFYITRDNAAVNGDDGKIKTIVFLARQRALYNCVLYTPRAEKKFESRKHTRIIIILPFFFAFTVTIILYHSVSGIIIVVIIAATWLWGAVLVEGC